MLIQILMNKPQMIGSIVSHTPLWVWGLLAGLLALGFSQVPTRTVGLRRVTITPIAMTIFSLWGAVTAFASSPQFGTVLIVWTGAAAAMTALIAPMAPAAGTQYDPVNRSFVTPGSWIPLVLIVGIFMTKYVVGVELAMQPTLVRDAQFTLVAGALYGLFSGIFIGRAARLWRLAARPAASTSAIVTA
jgi:hypothetical protein